MTTSLSSSRLDSSSSSANVGISVSNAFVGSLSSNVKFSLKRPSTVSPVVEIRSTLPSRICSRKTGLYGILTGSTRPGANSATKM